MSNCLKYISLLITLSIILHSVTGTDWIYLAQNIWRDILDTAMEFEVLLNIGNILNSRVQLAYQEGL